MSRPSLSRRRLLASLAGLAVGGPLAALLPRGARAADGVAERVIFFYRPDGVAGIAADGSPSKWEATGSERSFTLGEQQAPLQPWKDRCLFLHGLSMGGTDAGSHPGGAKKLLTATDFGNGVSIDQHLARTIGASSPWRHLYLGAQANVNGASGDKHVSYPSPGVSIAPEDDPRRAFALLFGSGGPADPGASDPGPSPADLARKTVLDAVAEDVRALRAKLGGVERARLDLHLESIREVEQRIDGVSPPAGSPAACEAPALDTGTLTDSTLYAPEVFPDVLRAQIDLMVLAMACGRTRVGTIQASHHTSELLMSRFAGTALYDPGFDLRSHQASHYGAAHDPNDVEYRAFLEQGKWWTAQFAYLLQRLAETPEGDGSMLDHSICVLVTEVSDGNTHSHDDLPVVVAGGAGGYWSTGRLLDLGYRRHGDLWVSVANALGDGITRFGDASSGPIPGL